MRLQGTSPWHRAVRGPSAPEAAIRLATERYIEQDARWPARGSVILAQFDEASVVVYQAYRREIGEFAARNGHFGGDFKLDRMTWIKPNFLWMMYRSGWGTKPEQEVTLAIRLRRAAFDEILAGAVHSSFARHAYANEDEWRRRVATSQVRLQWDPDHHPRGAPLERRAIQLGLRGEVVRKYSREWLLDIEDISEFVAEQRQVLANSGIGELRTPREEIYPVADETVRCRLGIERRS